MSIDNAIVIATTILIFSLVGLIVFVASRRQRGQEDELRRAASARGWKFEAKNEGGYRVHRWTGTTEGVSWIAESLRHGAGGNSKQKRTHIGRWHGHWNPGVSGAMLAMGLPKGKEQLGKAVADGDGFLARMMQKAAGYALDKSLDVYFGKEAGAEVDATLLHRLDAKTPGFSLMSVDTDEGSRMLQQGFESALVNAVHDTSSVLADEDRPWILLRPNAVSLARMKPFRNVAEVDAFVRAGVGLARGFKFGRPSGRREN